MMSTKHPVFTPGHHFYVFLLSLVLFTPAALSQVGASFNSRADQGSYNFGNVNAWAGLAVPGDSANITITNNTITMDVDKVIGTITLGPGGYIILGNSTVTILDQIVCNQLNGVYDNGGNSTVILK